MGAPECSLMMDYFNGRRILIVEDEFVIAAELAWEFEQAGAEIIGPVPNVEDALAFLERADFVQGAVLDINVGGGQVFPVADELSRRNVPFVFYTAFDEVMIPVCYQAAERLRKPADWRSLARALFEAPLTAVLH